MARRRFLSRLEASPRVFDAGIGRTLLVGGLLVAGFLPTFRDGHLLTDMTTYTQAADRLVHGGAIYASYPGDLTPYKYAPWFAVLWIPLVLLPSPILGALWLGTLMGCTAWLIWRAPWWLAIAAGPFVAWGATIGNAAPLMFVLLAVSVETRAAGVTIGMAASLKAFPILLIVPLLVRRRWVQAATALGVAAILAAPMLFFDLSGYQVSAEGPHSIYNLLGPAAWVVSAAAGLVLAIVRPSWRSAGNVVLLVNPRFQWYDVGYVLIGKRRARARPSEQSAARAETAGE